jgi:hypothetical protein
MADTFKFEDFDGLHKPLCLACEEMLTDSLDQTLTPADRAWFDQHIASCVDCSQMVADAQRGAAWLELLRSPRPEPSAALMERILAQTSGAEDGIPIVIGQPAVLPVVSPMPSNVLAFRPRLPKFPVWNSSWANSRLAMTAAMAFFSIALTLNLTGVRLDQLHAANVKHTYFEASAQAVRFYDNLPVVRTVESRVDTLRDANTNDAPKPEAKPETKPEPKTPGPTSQRRLPLARPDFVATSSTIQKPHQEGGLA